MRFWTARLLPFELLLPPTRFSARLVSASLLVAFVHLVRGPWDLHLRPFGRLHCQRGPFYVWMGDAESIVIRVTRQRPTKNGNSASEGLSMDRKSSEIFAAIERRLRADQEEGNHSAWAAAGSVDSSLNLLGVRSPSERAFKASIIEASSYHREWRAPLPRRKSTNPPANSCGREVTLLPSGCSRT